MLAYARLILANFKDDLADFSVFDSTLTQDTADGLQDAITAAQDFSSDYQMRGILVQKTQNGVEAMGNCRDFFQMAKYFILNAFRGEYGTLEEFGFGKYIAARSQQNLMIEFMENLFETATKYATELAAVGFDAAKVAEAQTLAETLQRANLEQEQAKGERASASDRRVKLLNAAWDGASQIRNAAKIVYKNNYGKWQGYKVPWASEPPEETNEFTGTVAFGETVAVPVPGLYKGSILTLHNHCEVSLRFCGGESSGLDCGDTGQVIDPGDSMAVMFKDLAPDGSPPKFLNVSNTISAAPGMDGRFGVIKNV